MAGKSVGENLKAIRERMSAAAVKAGRDPSQIHLVAVSKTKPIELIDEAFNAGQKIFAENYVQELIPKAEARSPINSGLEWHFIGRLQSNKIKQIVRDLLQFKETEEVEHLEITGRESEDEVSKIIDFIANRVRIPIKIERKRFSTNFAIKEKYNLIEEGYRKVQPDLRKAYKLKRI